MAHMEYEFPFTTIANKLLICHILLLNFILHQQILPCNGFSTGAKLGVHMVRSPESAVAPAKDEVLFECELNLEPERLEWRFRKFTTRATNGLQMDYTYLNKNNGFNITTYDGISKLRVYVSEASIGEYQCIAWFGASALASIPARLILASISLDSTNKHYNSSEINHNRRMLASHVINWKVHPGNSVLIKCGNVISKPQPVWNFYKNNISIPASNSLSTGTLILQSVTGVDSGTYTCSAINSITGIEIEIPQKITVDVSNTGNSPPKVLYPATTSFVARPGSSITLECPGVGNPVPKSVWSRPIGIIDTNRTQILPYGLQIMNVTSDDRGNYVCRLDNGQAPALIHNIRLDIQELPRIIEGPQETLTNESESLQLVCFANGYPTPDIYWMINGENTRSDPLIYTNGSRLIIKSVEKKHAGIVQCFARNEIGEVSESNLLQVKPKQITGESGSQPLGALPSSTKSNTDHTGKPPKSRKKHKHLMIPPSRPSVTRLSDDKVMVRWSVPSKEGLPIQFFKVQYRMLGNPEKKVPRSQWKTANEDIPPQVRMYEVDNLEPNHYYRFRIAAVYSNNDNKLSNVSAKFLLLHSSQLDPSKGHLTAPNLTRVEPISETAVVLHWFFPARPSSPVDGFYAYYRPASTAAEYSKATVDGMSTRHFKIDNLEPGTAYEFKLQSFTSSAASEFLAIITGKTLKPATPRSTVPDQLENETLATKPKAYFPVIAGGAAFGSLLLLMVIVICICIKRKRKNGGADDTNENKTHPEHIQAELNGFPSGNGRVLGSPIHKTSRLNGVAPRMNITSNPLATEGDKNRNVMELRFLPSSLAVVQHQSQHSQQKNNNCTLSSTDPHRRTLERSTRNLQHQYSESGDLLVVGGKPPLDPIECGRTSMRRPRRSSASTGGVNTPGPGSPRVVRGLSSELLHNRSPMPVRALTAAGNKRHRLGSQTENMSSNSLNSIDV